MEIVLSDRVAKLKPSASIAAKAIVNELRAQGRHIIDFTIGEPDLDTPAAIVEAGIAAMRAGEDDLAARAGRRRRRPGDRRKEGAAKHVGVQEPAWNSKGMSNHAHLSVFCMVR
jgi:aspartate aminotransferase